MVGDRGVEDILGLASVSWLVHWVTSGLETFIHSRELLVLRNFQLFFDILVLLQQPGVMIKNIFIFACETYSRPAASHGDSSVRRSKKPDKRFLLSSRQRIRT